jgi:hypothetical protein
MQEIMRFDFSPNFTFIFDSIQNDPVFLVYRR